jgi:hypothetical protein
MRAATRSALHGPYGPRVPVVTASPHGVPPQAVRHRAGPTIAVAGSGRARRAPDLMRFVLSVEAVRERAAEAMAAAGALADRVVAVAHCAGIAPEDIRTSDVSLRPEPAADAQGRRIAGFRAGESFRLTVRRLYHAGPTLELLAGACRDEMRIESVGFGVADREALRASARQRAFADASARAEHYAQLAGRGLGPLQSLDEQEAAPAAEYLPVGSAAQALMAADRAADLVSVEEQVNLWAVFAVH